MLEVEPFTVTAEDGCPLQATLFQGSSGRKKSVLISSAMAVPQRFYRHFASYLAELGFTVVTYDYRGIADSAPSSLRGFEAQMRDWGEKDMTAAVEWLSQTFPDQPIVLVGHSAGGQLAGFLARPERVEKLAIICSGSAYWRLFPYPLKAQLFVLYFVLLPLLTSVLGHGPGRLLRSGENVPRGVMRQWLHWARCEGYVTSEEECKSSYERFRAPIRAFGVADDPWATPKAVRALLRSYSKAESEFVLVTRRLGHFRYFRPGNEDLWDECADWF